MIVVMSVYNSPMPVRPHYADTFALDGEHCPMCCELASDAWERMTYGGIGDHDNVGVDRLKRRNTLGWYIYQRSPEHGVLTFHTYAYYAD